ncbi:MAG: MGH1-like glycoside hydrolase domain-containing protein, partial [bacterium]
MDAEAERLAETAAGHADWRKWGPYLSERQWATVREDYSPDGSCWEYFPHDHARSRAYRWGEDGLFGFSDRLSRLCFGLALWNGRDPILKERLFGLTGPEGNHGEDVKELYYYLDATPTHSYLKALYKYPQREFPYADLVAENRRRDRSQPEYELLDTGALDQSRYFDVQIEYAKADVDDVLVRITVSNRGPNTAAVHVLPTLWFRNTWSWGRTTDALPPKGEIRVKDDGLLVASQSGLGDYLFFVEPESGRMPQILATENETNTERLYGWPNASPFVKDAFHERIVHGREDVTNPTGEGTKIAPHFRLQLAPGESRVLRLRLAAAKSAPATPFGLAFERVFADRIREADVFYALHIPAPADSEEANVARQAYAGLIWNKQLFYYDVQEWLEGDPAQPAPPAERLHGRNADWRHLTNADVVSMPDKWEYPWYAAWDLAFHMV